MFIKTKPQQKRAKQLHKVGEQIKEELGNLSNMKSAHYSEYGLDQFQWEKILTQLAAIPLIRNETGKISMKETLASIKDGEVYDGLPGIDAKWAITILAHISSPKTIDPKWSRLSPLVMMAFKKYALVPYEDWDKNDPLISFALGKVLYESIYVNTKEDPDAYASAYSNPGEFRDLLLTTKAGTKKKATQYLGYDKNVYEHKWKGADPVKYMISQTWHAHHSLRTEYMILDIENWDNMPEPLDEIVTEEEYNNSDIPW